MESRNFEEQSCHMTALQYQVLYQC